ncbi:membrane hypothetical protein [Azospirillaceae bacterium]
MTHKTRISTVAVAALMLAAACPSLSHAQALSSPSSAAMAAQISSRGGSSAPIARQVAEAAAKPAEGDNMPDNVVAGLGCAAMATTAMAAAYLSSPTEVIMLIAGGLLVPSSSSLLALSLTSTLVGGSCAIGALATPGVLYLADQAGPISEQVAYQIGRVGSGVASLFGGGRGLQGKSGRQLAEQTN